MTIEPLKDLTDEQRRVIVTIDSEPDEEGEYALLLPDGHPVAWFNRDQLKAHGLLPPTEGSGE